MICSNESHAELKHVLIWPTLPRPRLWEFDWGEVHEMRDCPTCSSTLVVVVREGNTESEVTP